MKSLRKISSNQLGMSMLFMVLILSLAVGGIGYVTTDVIPKLQNEKKKAEAIISYRVFIGSLNDYLVHGIRERWCLNYSNGVTDMLMSNACGSNKPMEDIVTYPGNLERILWSSENIGSTLTEPPAQENSNKILALNYLRYHSNPQKTSRLLKYEDIRPPNGKLKFKITQAVLKDMTTEHPLYVMANQIKECVNEINIEIFQVDDFNNIGGGDERKLGIHITSDIIKTRLNCMTLKQADSTSYYTFYPRRLHTFSLVKYGNLDGKLHNEFHGPVYVAGDFVLPPPSANKNVSSVFYNTLTLGIFNSGKNNGAIYRAGLIANSDKSKYTFSDRGHPYRSKQDYYENFRGFLGGVHLDSSEDKGFHNLFDYSSVSSGDVGTLEACIEENNALLKPSVNYNTLLAYSGHTATQDSLRLKLSFTKRNRFKPSNEAGQPSKDYNQTSEPKPKKKWWGWGDDDESSLPNLKDRKFLFDISSPEGNRALGSVAFRYGEENYGNPIESYSGTMGVGTQVQMALNLPHFDLISSKLESFINNTSDLNRSNYKNVIEWGHILYNIPETNDFRKAGDDLDYQCNRRTSEQCDFFGYTNPTCDSEKDKTCDYSREISDYQAAKDRLKTKLEEVKQLIDSNKLPMMTVTLAHVEPHLSKEVLNQRFLDFSFTPEWKPFFDIAKSKIIKNMRFSFTPYHYGPYSNLYIDINVKASEGGEIDFLNRTYGKTSENFRTIGWMNTYNNKVLEGEDEPKPLVGMDCPDGMGVADWDLDMSGSTNFAWNYANTPPGAQVDSSDHAPASPITFEPGDGNNPPFEGHAPSTTKSVVEECTIPANRTHVYGFYVCNKLIIEERSTPLYMVGTFIVNELVQPAGMNVPVHWHSIWDTKASDLIMTDLNGQKPACDISKNLMNKTWVDIINNVQVSSAIKACSPLDLVTNGPNNFSWTTVDPDIGIANPGDVMTSQKTNRIQKWVIREESRVDTIR